MTPHTVHQVVRLTARSSALLFAAAQGSSALKPAQRASRPLYVAFMIAHAVHFVAVTRYAVHTGGRNLFPGGRSLQDVGGWRTVAGIYGAFAGLALTGWAGKGPTAGHGEVRWPIAEQVTTGIIGAMFVGTYFGQLPRSRWLALPATAVAAGEIAHLLTVGQGARRVSVQLAPARV